VTLERIDQHVAVQWNDGGIPQVIRVDAEAPDEDFPVVPSEMAANDARIVTALRDAAATADNNATRYALNCLQLQGEPGKVAATDGRQLLIQHGFDFPWDDDVLIPARKVFASRELLNNQSAEVGRSDDWVCFRIGPWILQFKIEKESRFPRVEDHVPKANSAATTLRLSAADAEFLINALKRLPNDDDGNRPVTVDLNGTVAVRAKSEEQSAPTELILTNTSRSGEVIRFNTNRDLLARAVKLGFREVRLTGPEAPAVCCDQNRQYLWALLGKDGAIESRPQAIRIESPHVDDVPPKPKPNRKRPTMSQAKTNPNGQSRRNGAGTSNGTDTGSENQAGADALIEQAEAVKTSLRETLANTSELIASLKKHRKQTKLVRSTLASLRQLQSINA